MYLAVLDLMIHTNVDDFKCGKIKSEKHDSASSVSVISDTPDIARIEFENGCV
jgi:hypothetical protein